MTFTRRMVGRPVTVLMIFLIIVAVGGITLDQLSVDLFPEIDPPILAVNTGYRANPEEVEENVTEPLEGAVANVSGLDMLSSTSSRGSSSIVMEFGWGVDMTEATNDVRDALERVAGTLPEGASDPQILRFDPNAQPIMTVALSGELTPEELRRIAEDELQSPLERISGVGQVNVTGGRSEVVLVRADASALHALGLTISRVADAVGRGGIELSGGSVVVDERNLLLRATGEYSNLDEIEGVVVGRTGGPGGRAIRLGEVADVRFGYEEADSYVYVNGDPAVNVSVVPESGANTVEVADEVRSRLSELGPALREGVEVTVTSDRSGIISDTLDQVTSSMLIGALFAMAVLLFFLHNLKAAITIGVSIPVSLLATFMAMGARGLTLNLLSMSGLVLGIGLIVDSSIVVLENIERHRRDGEGLSKAAIAGTQEMISPITASALTTISVFVPIILFRDELGIIGILFGDISFVIIVAIVSALAVATLLVPVLSSSYLKLGGAGTAHSGPFGFVSRRIEGLFARLEAAFARLLRSALRWKGVTVALAFSLLIASFALVPALEIIFAPAQPQEGVSLRLTLRPGSELEATDEVARAIARRFEERFPTLETIVVESGSQGGFGPFGGEARNEATIDITLPPLGEREITLDEVRSFARSEVEGRPEATLSFIQGGPQLGAANPIDIVVQSEDLEALSGAAGEVLSLLRQEFPEVTEPGRDVSEPSPQLVAAVDRNRAADLGVSPAAIVNEIRTGVAGRDAAVFRSRGEEWDVVVRLPEGQRRSPEDLGALSFPAGGGERIALSNLVSFALDQTPSEINRENQIRTIHVTGGLAPAAVASEVQPRIEDAIGETLSLPPSVTVDFSGELTEIQETTGQIGLVFLLAILLVFAIMASQFESFRMPLIIFLTIPLMLIGAILIHVILGQQVSMFSLMGLVVLAGIVVNNAIVLVDYTNLLRVRGREAFEAALEAGRLRFRPIVMTTFTTVFGMVPLALFPGEGAELTQPVAVSVVGGLAVSSVTTLFVVPALYLLIAGGAEVRKRDTADEAA